MLNTFLYLLNRKILENGKNTGKAWEKSGKFVRESGNHDLYVKWCPQNNLFGYMVAAITCLDTNRQGVHPLGALKWTFKIYFFSHTVGNSNSLFNRLSRKAVEL